MKLQGQKEKLITKLNERREDISISPNQKITEKTFVRCKGSNKYKPSTIAQSFDPISKTIRTPDNKTIHVSNIKRPPKNLNSDISGPSSASDTDKT